MDITEKQQREMKHALGLDWEKKPYRNRFQTTHDDEDWNDLVGKGLAEKGTPKGIHCWFWLTKQGAELAYEKRISKAKFDGL